jgi:hypothetical protein
MVMVNTVVIVQGVLDLDRQASAYAFAVFGFGSILGALAITPALRACRTGSSCWAGRRSCRRGCWRGRW